MEIQNVQITNVALSLVGVEELEAITAVGQKTQMHVSMEWLSQSLPMHNVVHKMEILVVLKTNVALSLVGVEELAATIVVGLKTQIHVSMVQFALLLHHL